MPLFPIIGAIHVLYDPVLCQGPGHAVLNGERDGEMRLWRDRTGEMWCSDVASTRDNSCDLCKCWSCCYGPVC